jgi:ABC-type enterochelin transport system permease subunit
MEILLPGIICAAIAWLYKPAGVILAIIGILPVMFAGVSGIFQVNTDPSSLQQVTDNIMTATANAIVGEIKGLPGAILFGATIGLLIPKGK